MTLRAQGYKMESGITRYTLGAFNQSALDDVYNKAKEIYTDDSSTTPPPSSGVIINTKSLIWDDMHLAPTAYPVASSLTYSLVYGPVFKGQLGNVTPDWGKTNAWFEVEETSNEECPNWVPDSNSCVSEYSCKKTINLSSNTMVELTPMWLSFRENGVWREVLDGTGSILNGTVNPSPHQLFQTNRGCNVAEIEAIREEWAGYTPHLGSNGSNQLYKPDHYYRWHGFGGAFATNYLTLEAIYACQYARLVLIDPSGEDDRFKAKFNLHVSSDRKMADGTQIPDQEGWGSAGSSRFKEIPTNGDWMPVNFIDGFITEEELIDNPPNFPTSPIT